MRVVAWNVGPRAWWKILRSFRGIDPADKAKVTALFEASNRALVAALRARYPRRRVICRRTDVVAILRRGAPRPRVEVIEHDAAWSGPHTGRKKRGRRWLLLIWDDFAVLLIHRVTPIGNDAAWEAENELIAEVANRWDIERLAVIGDHNGTDDRLREVYAEMGLKLLPANTKVDQAAVRDCQGRGIRLGDHGSDHVAMLWILG